MSAPAWPESWPSSEPMWRQIVSTALNEFVRKIQSGSELYQILINRVGCHPEPSEGSPALSAFEGLRGAQHDTQPLIWRM
jgi:hypothetical protein